MTALCIESFPPTALSVPPHDTIEPDGLPTRCVAIAARHPAVLPAIHRPEVNLAVWDRAVPPSLAGDALDTLMHAAPFTVIAEAPPRAIGSALSERLPAPAAADLLGDITDLALFFAALDGDARSVRVRLEALTHDGCSRWHADAIGLRLLCTYRGPGTEWLPLDGGAATARGIGRDRPPCAAAALPTGAVAILKGEGHPGNQGAGCIHRSPPAGPGKRARLLLCIDQTQWNLRE
jgi:hypothetical protein